MDNTTSSARSGEQEPIWMPQQAFHPSGNGAAVQRARSILAARLRSAEGRLPGRWSESVSFPGCVEVNETFALVYAWRRWDPEVARDLVLTALSGEQPGGVLPRRFFPDGRVVDAGAPWPLLAQATRMAWQADPRTGNLFLPTALPALIRILEYSLDLFDPGARGQTLWPSEQEAYLPELWAEGLRSVDLSAFLLAEIEAVAALAGESDSTGATPIPAFLNEARRRLAENLERDHWAPSMESFRDRMTHGAMIARETVASVFPLLWPNLRADFRDALLRRARAPDELMTPTGIAAWEAWPDDPQPPAIRAMDQILLLTAFRAAESESDATRLQEAVFRRSANETDLFENCLLAGFADSARTDGRPAPWWKRNGKRTAVFASVVFVLFVAALLWAAAGRGSMPGPSLEVLAGLAKHRYRSGDWAESIRLYRMILDESKSAPPTLHAHYGNALFRQGKFTEAESHYRIALLGPDSDNPVLLFNLAQSIHRQGRPEEARKIFRHLLLEYQDFPAVIRAVRDVMAFLEERKAGEKGNISEHRMEMPGFP